MQNIEFNFDPLEAEIEALDDAFYRWFDSLSKEEQDEYGGYVDSWHEARRESTSYTMDEIYEAYGSDIEEFHAVNNQVVDKRMYEEIQRKRRLIHQISEGSYEV